MGLLAALRTGLAAQVGLSAAVAQSIVPKTTPSSAANCCIMPQTAAFVRQGQSPQRGRDAGNAVARVSPDPLDRPRITRSKSDGLRPHSIGRTSRRTPRVHGRTRPLFIGQTSLALPRVNRTDSHSESPRPLSHGRISPALGRPTPIQPFPNPDMDGINRHSTTNQPSFVSNPRTISAQPSHIYDPYNLKTVKPLLNRSSECKFAAVPLARRERICYHIYMRPTG